MTTWFVSRHRGALAWAGQEGMHVDRQVEHLDTGDVQPGDIVIGSLPVQMAAEVCERGGRYFHLSLDLPQALRGRELSAEEMRACKARLEEFCIRRCSGEA